jgi:pimeloyl-ACP methyl ester carboxylesterase
MDLHGVLAQFGFEQAVLAAEGLGCVVALLLAAWFPKRVSALALIDPRFDAPQDETLLARSLRDCPVVRPAMETRVVEVAGNSPTLVGVLEQLLINHPLP